MTEEKPKTMKEELKDLPTHCWVRENGNDHKGAWHIEEITDKNIHYVNDPTHFSKEVIAIPRRPIHQP
jgi:hypothetical protein